MSSIFEIYSKHLNLIDLSEFSKYERSFHNYKYQIYLGNGGSNAISSHIAQDACKIHQKYALSFSDTSMLSCFANDFGYENIFVEFLKIFSKSETLVILISSSGNSQNIINALNWCQENNIHFGILTGFDKNNKCRKLSKNHLFDLHVNSDNYGVVECIHQILLHAAI